MFKRRRRMASLLSPSSSSEGELEVEQEEDQAAVDDDDDDEGEGLKFVADDDEGLRDRRCGKGHRRCVLLPMQSSSSSVWCLDCFSALLSDPSSPCHHVSYALSQLSLLLSPPPDAAAAAAQEADDALHSLLPAAARVSLVTPLLRALFCPHFTRDDALARQLIHTITVISTRPPRYDQQQQQQLIHVDFISRIAQHLSSGSLTAWNHRHHLYLVHSPPLPSLYLFIYVLSSYMPSVFLFNLQLFNCSLATSIAHSICSPYVVCESIQWTNELSCCLTTRKNIDEDQFIMTVCMIQFNNYSAN